MSSSTLQTFLAPIAILLAGITTVFGSPRNVTVDDNDPAVVYSPANDWSFGPECSTCTVHLAASQVKGGTWHDTLFSSSDQAEDNQQTASYTFTGSAVYVYGILSNANDNPNGNADQKIFINSRQVGTFKHVPDGTGSFVYNALLYANSSLPYGSHTLMIQNGEQGDLSSLILLDYFVYTTDSDPSDPPAPPQVSPAIPSHSPGSTAANPEHSTTIALGVLVPLLVVLSATLAALFIWYRRRRRLVQSLRLSLAESETAYGYPFTSPTARGGPRPEPEYAYTRSWRVARWASRVKRSNGTRHAQPMSLTSDSLSGGGESIDPPTSLPSVVYAAGGVRPVDSKAAVRFVVANARRGDNGTVSTSGSGHGQSEAGQSGRSQRSSMMRREGGQLGVRWSRGSVPSDYVATMRSERSAATESSVGKAI